MGFQRETASRGTLAMYTSVSLRLFYCLEGDSTVLGCVCCRVRVHRVSHNTDPTLDRWGDHNHERGRLYFRNILFFSSQFRSCSCPIS
jgi:hypothetical protein